MSTSDLEMLILLTGSAGSVGSAVLLYLLERSHHVVFVDILPLPSAITSQIQTDQQARLSHHVVDLTHYEELDRLFPADRCVDAVIHLSAIPTPLYDDARKVHTVNVCSTYNVLKTAIDHGVKRIVSASSVNAPGLSYTPEGRQRFDCLPITEDASMLAMDAYALSKQINEIQAESLVRTYPSVRIASLRFHMVVPSYDQASPRSRWQDLFSWVSHRACAEACLLGITSEGWDGAEAFNIVAPDICWETSKSEPLPNGCIMSQDRPTALELVKAAWAGRVDSIKEEYWEGRPRGAFWDTSKAERMLGWKHE